MAKIKLQLECKRDEIRPYVLLFADALHPPVSISLFLSFHKYNLEEIRCKFRAKLYKNRKI